MVALAIGDMVSVKAKHLYHPLVLLGLGFLVQMCASASGHDTPATTDTSTGGSVDAGVCAVAGDCMLPPSRCSESGTALVYYTSPTCANMRCS